MKVKQVIIHKIDLQKILRKKGLTVKALAKKLGVGTTCLYNYEANYRVCSWERWQKISKILAKN